jgi:hypothetical protein
MGITKKNILKAMLLVEDSIKGVISINIKSATSLEQKLAMVLEDYHERHTYDGTYKSAVRCLTESCFEISADVAKAA